MSGQSDQHVDNLKGLIVESEAWVLDGPAPLGPQSIASILHVIQELQCVASELHRVKYDLGETRRRLVQIEADLEAARVDRDRYRRKVESLEDSQRWARLTGRAWR